MKILHEDKDQIVIHKPAGLATQTARLGERDLVSEVKNHICKESGTNNPYLAVINRLDQPVEGIVLFAKNAKAAATLSAQMQDSTMKKYYYAAIYGHMEAQADCLTDYVEKDNRRNLSRVVSGTMPGAKKAVLDYETVSTVGKMQLVKIHLLTGRHHQIRVQFAHRGHPLMGDTKYGSMESISLGKELNVRVPALCAFQLEWKHPVTQKDMTICVIPEHSMLKEFCEGQQ